MFLPHPRVKVSIVESLRDREVACSASDRQGSNFESCVWRTVSSHSSHHPQEVLLAHFSLYVHKGGLKPDSFHFIYLITSFIEFQLQLSVPRDHVTDIVQRAQRNGFKAMVLTIDEPVFRISYGKQIYLGNFSYPNARSNSITDKDRCQSWEDVAWLKRRTTLPLVVKGLLDASQVTDALNAGVDAIMVSNHGGRYEKRSWKRHIFKIKKNILVWLKVYKLTQKL